jgi:hypothetical protein
MVKIQRQNLYVSSTILRHGEWLGNASAESNNDEVERVRVCTSKVMV